MIRRSNGIRFIGAASLTHRRDMKDELVTILRMLTNQPPAVMGDLPAPDEAPVEEPAAEEAAAEPAEEAADK